MVLMKNNTSIGNNLEMCPSGRIEGPTLVTVDEFSKSPKYEEERENGVGDSNVANEETIQRPTENHGGGGETFREDGRYLTKKCHPLLKW